MKRSRVGPSPIFSSESRPDKGARLLLLSAHFPPGQAAGARRWEKLARFAVDRGFGLDVVTIDPRDLESSDATRLASLPEHVRVVTARSRPHWLSRLVDGIWGWLRPLLRSNGVRASDPDQSAGQGTPMDGSDWPRREEILAAGWTGSSLPSVLHAVIDLANEATWSDAAVRVASKLLDTRVHRAIISCGPPHMIHHAATRLAKRTGLPLILDLRDPWSRRERLPGGIASPLWFRLVERLEAKSFEAASLVVMNTPPASQLMARVYPHLAHKIISVPNGFDDETVFANPGSTFVIAYAGTIYLDRSPRLLFRGAARVARELDLGSDDLRIELMGSYDAGAIRAMAREEGVEDRVDLHPPGTRRDVAGLLSRAAMLVNLPQDSDLAIPSKVFDYMVQPAWLLALAVPDSATGQILAGTRADVVAPDDVEAIAGVIRERFRAYRAGERPRPVGDDPRLGRAYQARILLDAIERCIGRGAGGDERMDPR